MLARPEIGTRVHVKLWLASKDPNERYDWDNKCECACGQYTRQFYADHKGDWLIAICSFPGQLPVLVLAELNSFAAMYDPATGYIANPADWTFGNLYKTVCLKWHDEP